MNGVRGDNGGERSTGNIWYSESVIDLLPIVESNAGVRYVVMLSNSNREDTGLIPRFEGVQSSYRL